MNEPNDVSRPDGAPAEPSVDPAVLRPLSWIAAVVVFALMALTAVDVGGRYIFNAPVPGATFLAAALMGVMIFVALPLVTVRDEQLRAGLLDHLFKGAAKRLKERLVLVVSLLTLSALTYVLWRQGVIYDRTNAQLPSIGLGLGTIAFLGAAMSGVSAVIVLITMWRHFLAPSARRPE
ncbi:MAG: TRAP transporter small permease [Alphaproteobacteria bacterium]